MAGGAKGVCDIRPGRSRAGTGHLRRDERGVRRGPRDGEDGALDGRADRGVAGVGGLGHRSGDRLRRLVLQRGAGEVAYVGAEHLAQDHPGVATRPQQRRTGQDGHALPQPERGVGRSCRAQLVAGRGDGEEHVGAGVAVGDRVDVEGVDLLTRRGQGVGRDVDEPGDPVQGDAVGDWLHRVGVLPVVGGWLAVWIGARSEAG